MQVSTHTATCQLAGDWGAELAVQEGGGIRVDEEGDEDAEEEVESGDSHHDCQGVHPLTVSCDVQCGQDSDVRETAIILGHLCFIKILQYLLV